ncbi:MAG TPA: Holliday junction resolvase RuvX, partial [Nitrospira sp.]|nr:Holliday junction resolvase RuvX [Nitrospira sp.]
SVPLVLWDERMTTKAAEDLLIAADVSRKKRKGAVDRVAAAILLQSYLASREAAASSPPEWQDSQVDESTVHITHATAEHSRSSAGRGRRSRRGRISDH